MIDLLSLDRYYEIYLSHLPSDSPTRKWWDGLSFKEQCAISYNSVMTEDYKADRRMQAYVTYGDND